MAKEKITIELSTEQLNKLKEQYEANCKLLKDQNPYTKFEDFVADILENFVKIGDQVRNMQGKMDRIMEILGPQFEGLSDIFNDGLKPKKEEKKNSDPIDESKIKN